MINFFPEYMAPRFLTLYSNDTCNTMTRIDISRNITTWTGPSIVVGGAFQL